MLPSSTGYFTRCPTRDGGLCSSGSARGRASVSELAAPLPMSLAAALQHVQVLEASGLVQSRKVGRTRTCAIDQAVLRSAEDWIAGRRALVERRLDRLGDYLAATASFPPASSHHQRQEDS